MANPGYPMQPPMMGNPPPGMRPSMPPQQMQPPPQMRSGTPKAVPIMVSAGLAIGVFCGLLFGVGTGESEAKADAPKDKQFVGTKIDGTDETATATGPTGPTPPKSVTDGTLATGTMKQPKPAAGSAVGSAAGSATVATPTVPTVPEIKMAKLVIAIKPDTVKDAKITVDGVEVVDNKLELALGDKTKKEVSVVVKAPGYRDLEQKLEVNEGETNVEYQLVKKRSGGGSTTPKRPPPPGGSGKKKKKGGGGLIDI